MRPTSGVLMSSLCYPYGSGITCVCEEGKIYKCFPDLKSHSSPSPEVESDTNDHLNHRILDRRFVLIIGIIEVFTVISDTEGK